MDTAPALIELAYAARLTAELREAVLALLCQRLEAEVGVFVAIEGGRDVRAHCGLCEIGQTALDAIWGVARRELEPVKQHAVSAGAATDRQVLGKNLARTELFQRVMVPLGGTETLILVPRVRDRILGMLALGRCGGYFSPAALAHAKDLVPALSVAYCAVSANADPMLELTAIELDLLDYLELGWGTRQIAAARGTSFFTVRNQLSAMYRKLDVTNRAEAIGLRRGTRRSR
jgi:DNA-binding CsgD family transcriptional regulator